MPDLSVANPAPMTEQLALCDAQLRTERGIVDVASHALAQHAFGIFADELADPVRNRLQGGMRGLFRSLFECWRTRAMDAATGRVIDALLNEAGGEVGIAMASLTPIARLRIAQIVVAHGLTAYHGILRDERPYADGPMVAVTQAQAWEQRGLTRGYALQTGDARCPVA